MSGLSDGQVFWLPVHPTCRPSHPPEAGSGIADFRPGYSGATATDSHRLPFIPLKRQLAQVFKPCQGQVVTHFQDNRP